MYKLLPKQKTPLGEVDSQVVQRLSDSAFIPMNPDNTDYQAYLRWLSEGNTPTPAEEQGA
jgi:hypothetical protein